MRPPPNARDGAPGTGLPGGLPSGLTGPRSAPLWLGLLAVWLGSFSIPSSKLVGYALPALAPWCALPALVIAQPGRRAWQPWPARRARPATRAPSSGGCRGVPARDRPRFGRMKHFIRYSAVGAFATAVHYLLLVGHYLLAQVVATLANLLLTFAINRASTFR